MSYIIPDGTIQLFSDIGLSPNYDNCLYFATVVAKDNYFDALPKIATFASCSYSRQQRGYIRVDANISRVYNAGYMRFKNTSFENKWFYAFVTSVEYIANNTTQINFTLDIMTTWMGSFNLGQCWIERQHTISDAIGQNIADEDISVGKYIIEKIDSLVSAGYYVCVVTSSEDGGSNAGGIYNGCKLNTFTTMDGATIFLKKLIDDNKSDNVVCIYMLPTRYYNADAPSSVYRHERTYDKPYNSLHGYIPKNNKLFCYPYKFLRAVASDGDTQEFRYEFFNSLPPYNSTQYSFLEVATVGSTTQAGLIPIKYARGDEGYINDQECMITVGSYPLCSWNVDTYRAYLAQVNSNAPLNIAQGALNGSVAGASNGIGNGILGSILGGISGAVMGALPQVTNLLVSNAVRPEQGTKNKGSQQNDLNVAIDSKGFLLEQVCISENYAQMIDDYFTSFGYAVKNVGTPNMNARPHWTYVKTVDCIVHGNLPSEDAGKIENIFNNGVRFWKTHTEIGNYSLDNSPA